MSLVPLKSIHPTFMNVLSANFRSIGAIEANVVNNSDWCDRVSFIIIVELEVINAEQQHYAGS